MGHPHRSLTLCAWVRRDGFCWLRPSRRRRRATRLMTNSKHRTSKGRSRLRLATRGKPVAGPGPRESEFIQEGAPVTAHRARQSRTEGMENAFSPRSRLSSTASNPHDSAKHVRHEAPSSGRAAISFHDICRRNVADDAVHAAIAWDGRFDIRDQINQLFGGIWLKLTASASIRKAPRSPIIDLDRS